MYILFKHSFLKWTVVEKITNRLFTGPVTVSHKCKIIDKLPHRTFGGHVKSSVTWLFDSPYAISHWWSFETDSLNPAVFEILRSKRIGVTSLTFQGHVASSATWPFDSPYAISYWWSFGTKPLSLTVSEIFKVKCNAMVDVTLIDL